jgi:hypothetical protein
MKQGSTLFLRGAIVLIGIAVVALCVLIIVILSSEDVGYYRPVLLGMYVPAIPFFLALYQAWKLLGYIDQNKAFSEFSVQALNNIKYLAIVISILYAIGMPYIFMVADRDDAPGVVLIGLVIVFASIVVATFAALLKKLVQNAVRIKSENDLTV